MHRRLRVWWVRFWLIFRFSSWKTYLLAGLFAGLAVVIEYPALIIALLLAIYAVMSARKVAYFFVGALAMAAVLGAYNVLAFGKVFFSAYQALGHNGSGFVGMALGFAGIHWPGLHGFLEVLWQILIVPQRGLLYINPILFLAIGGFYLWYRSKTFRLELALVAVMTLLMVIFVACYGDSIVYWGGGASTGPRQLVLLLPFLALPLGFAAMRWRNLFLVLLVAGATTMLMATAVEPRVPYDYANPLLDFFIPHFLSGQFGLNRDAMFDSSHHGIVGFSTAVNAGGLVGLSGVLQLIPLILMWVVVSFRNKQKAIAVALVIIAFAPILHREMKGFPDPASAGLSAQYWNNDTFEGTPVITRQEQVIDENWRSSLPVRTPFSVRWSGTVHIAKPGQYIFSIESDDGARLMADGVFVIDDWGPHSMHRSDKALMLSAVRILSSLNTTT